MADNTLPKVAETALPVAAMENVTHVRVVSTDNSEKLPINNLTIAGTKVTVAVDGLSGTVDGAFGDVLTSIAGKADTTQVEALDAEKVDKVTDIEQVRSQATNKVPSSKIFDDELAQVETDLNEMDSTFNSTFQDLSGEVYNIVDQYGYIIATIGIDGIKTTQVECKRNASESDSMYIIDSNSNILAKFDSDGLHVTKVNTLSPHICEVISDFGSVLDFSESMVVDCNIKEGVVYKVKCKSGNAVTLYYDKFLTSAVTINPLFGENQFKATKDCDKLFCRDSVVVDIRPITITTIKNSFRYMAATFNSSSTNSPYGMSWANSIGLWMMGSNDLKKFETIGYVYKPQLAGDLRDPSICFVDGWYHILYTINELGARVDGISGQRYIGHCKTRDFISYEESALITINPDDFKTHLGDDFNFDLTVLWAPQYCYDHKNGKYIVSMTVLKFDPIQNKAVNGVMSAYEFDFNGGHLGNLLAVYNLRYDTQVIWKDGYYYYFTSDFRLYKSIDLGVGITECNIGLVDEAHLRAEASFVIKLDDGRYRWYMQSLLIDGVNDHRIVYHDSDTSNFEGSWGDENIILFSEDTGFDYTDGYPGGYPSHWTIYDFNNKIV